MCCLGLCLCFCFSGLDFGWVVFAWFVGSSVVLFRYWWLVLVVVV